MRVVFANSADVTVPERLVLRGGRWSHVRLKVRYGVVIHPVFGPVLIDTGYGPQVTCLRHRSVMLKLYAGVLRPKLNLEESPVAVLEHFGFDAESVKYVVVTHFHADHIAQLAAFPNARFIVDTGVWKVLKQRSDFRNILDGVFTELLPDDFERRLICKTGCRRAAVPILPDDGADLLGDGSLMAVDLPGHALGHFGVVFPGLSVPLLYAVDVQWHYSAIAEGRMPDLPASLVASDKKALAKSAEQVCQFVRNGGDVVLCHDPCDSAFDYQPGTL